MNTIVACDEHKLVCTKCMTYIYNSGYVQGYDAAITRVLEAIEKHQDFVEGETYVDVENLCQELDITKEE